MIPRRNLKGSPIIHSFGRPEDVCLAVFCGPDEAFCLGEPGKHDSEWGV